MAMISGSVGGSARVSVPSPAVRPSVTLPAGGSVVAPTVIMGTEVAPGSVATGLFGGKKKGPRRRVYVPKACRKVINRRTKETMLAQCDWICCDATQGRVAAQTVHISPTHCWIAACVCGGPYLCSGMPGPWNEEEEFEPFGDDDQGDLIGQP